MRSIIAKLGLALLCQLSYSAQATDSKYFAIYGDVSGEKAGDITKQLHMGAGTYVRMISLYCLSHIHSNNDVAAYLQTPSGVVSIPFSQPATYVDDIDGNQRIYSAMATPYLFFEKPSDATLIFINGRDIHNVPISFHCDYLITGTTGDAAP